MNWDAIGAVSSVIALLLTLFLEWPRIRERWLESRQLFKWPFSPTIRVTERLMSISGYVIIIGVLLLLTDRNWPDYQFFFIGRFLFAFGCLGLGYCLFLQNRLPLQKNAIGHDQEPSSYKKFTTKLTTFVSVYLILFGIAASIATIWAAF